MEELLPSSMLQPIASDKVFLTAICPPGEGTLTSRGSKETTKAYEFDRQTTAGARFVARRREERGARGDMRGLRRVIIGARGKASDNLVHRSCLSTLLLSLSYGRLSSTVIKLASISLSFLRHSALLPSRHLLLLSSGPMMNGSLICSLQSTDM